MNEGWDALVAIGQARRQAGRQAERKGKPQPACRSHLSISITTGTFFSQTCEANIYYRLQISDALYTARERALGDTQ